MPYENYYGGVCAISKEHFKKINGFSNIYFDWGGEDDDLLARFVKYIFFISLSFLTEHDKIFKSIGYAVLGLINKERQCILCNSRPYFR